MPGRRVYKPECKEQRKHLVRRKTPLNSASFTQFAVPGFDFICPQRTCFFQEVSKRAEYILHLEVELETEPVWLWEKEVNDFTASLEYCPPRVAGGP